MNRRAQLICVWCGPALTVLFAIGSVLLARFIPPWIDPSDSAREVAAVFTDHTDRIRIGLFITMISMSLIAPWGVAIAAQTRRLEGSFPILTYVQLVCVAIGTTVVVFMTMFWAVAAFRPTEVAPEFVRVVNDLGYFAFLYTWPPFAIWTIAIALAILLDKSERPVYPRWAAYLCLWTAFLFIPAGLMSFFKTGAFAWNGLLALYVPVVVFFIWLIAMTVLTIKNIKRGAHEPDGTDDLPLRERPTAAPAREPARLS